MWLHGRGGGGEPVIAADIAARSGNNGASRLHCIRFQRGPFILFLVCHEYISESL